MSGNPKESDEEEGYWTTREIRFMFIEVKKRFYYTAENGINKWTESFLLIPSA